MSYGKELSQLGMQLPSRPPSLWIKRLVLYASVRENKIIRDIALRPGMNIVWSTPQSPSIKPLGGHNAGKTTFCRLLRYCLGEKSFGTAKNQKQIASLYPHGMVGAEIEIHGNSWAVARSFKPDGQEIGLQHATLEELWLCKTPEPFQHFLNALEQSFLPRLAVATFAKNGFPIRWGHLLAWLARDQETRFSEFHQFRDPRSESHAPSFTKAKEDAQTLLRSTLHFFNTGTEAEQARLQEIKQQLRNIAQEHLKSRRESEYWDHEMTLRLREKLDIPLDEEISWDSNDLFHASIKQRYEIIISKIGHIVDNHKSILAKIAIELQNTNREIGSIETELAQINSLIGVKRRTFSELSGEANKAANDPLEEWRTVTCKAVNIPVIECHLAREKWEREKNNTVDFQKHHNSQRDTRQASAEADDLPSLEQQVVVLESRKQELEQQLNKLSTQENQEREGLRKSEKKAQSLTDLVMEASNWRERRQGKDTENRHREEQKRMLEKERDRINTTIYQMGEEHRNHIRSFQSLFNAIVQEVLSSAALGQIQLDGDTPLFSLLGNQSSLGEAATSLSVTLGDIASLIFSQWKDCAFPGLLIHDSPRDADMAEGLYHNLLLFMAWFQTEFSQDPAIPYQYILTTTTPPPNQLQTAAWIRLELNSNKSEDLLLKRDFNIGESCLPGLFD